jgi:hypothetical protein
LNFFIILTSRRDPRIANWQDSSLSYTSSAYLCRLVSRAAECALLGNKSKVFSHVLLVLAFRSSCLSFLSGFFPRFFALFTYTPYTPSQLQIPGVLGLTLRVQSLYYSFLLVCKSLGVVPPSFASPMSMEGAGC